MKERERKREKERERERRGGVEEEEMNGSILKLKNILVTAV